MSSWRGIAVWVGCAIALAACAACRPPYLAHPGPRRAASEIARIGVVRGSVIGIDGNAIFAANLEVLPGEHEVVASFLIRGDAFAPGVSEDAAARLDCRCKSQFLAGGRYQIQLLPNQPRAQLGAYVLRQVHEVALIDEATGRRLLVDSECRWRTESSPTKSR